ncbi:MAG TPA: M43 family zinc metalloprotease, partial [Bacteroidia bacterium]|nr:M43 family zinc metalloprotease [Bacteroidia bacterium]
MKKIYFATWSLAILFANITVAQNTNRCATQPPSAAWDNWFNAKVESFKQQTASQRNGNATVYTLNTYTIPVVFHIIHGGQAVGTYPNLAQAQINSQITVLNQDYGGAGFQTSTYPATAFTAYAAAPTNSVSAASIDANGRIAIANTGISFALATKDPNGNTLAEPGIDRVDYTTKGWANPNSYTVTTTFMNFMDGTVKPATIWDVTKYFNIWVSDESTQVGLLGYSTFPASSTLTGLTAPYGSTTTDGCWFYAKVCGSKNIYAAGTYDPTYCYGRTICHETGHYLGLRHTWGDNGQCGGTDYCKDTPPEKGQSGNSPAGCYYGCPTYPSQPGTCTNGGQTNTDGDMFMNIMDYTDDACMYMFTNDQAIRMQTALANSPNRPHTSGGAIMPPCDANFTYTVSANGQVNFTNAPSQYYSWTFGDNDSSSLSNPVHTYTAIGNYSVHLFTSVDSLFTDTCSTTQLINIASLDTCAAPSVNFALVQTSPQYWDLYVYYSPVVTNATWHWGDGTDS